MTGYQEILTDPSYARQLVTLTYPQIGNVGVNAEDMESSRVFCAGLIIRNLPHRDSNWRSEGTLEHWLQEQGVVAIGHIDTRRLTRLIRTKGAQSGCIVADGTLDAEAALVSAKAFPGLAGMDLAKEVCVTRSYPWNAGTWSLGSGYTTPQTARFKVVAYDFGIKHNLLRLLSDRGCRLTVVPAYTEAEQVIAENPDGVFLSNGPGDPEPCGYAIAAIRKILDRNIPVFGICLGHQLLALASGARTVKMKFGHHGANHPVQDLDSGQVLITSQNHGFAVDEDSIGDAVKITHRSLFDGTVQGIERLDKPAFSFQGHPEASPGPHDIGGLFDRFVAMMASKTQSEVHAQEN